MAARSSERGAVLKKLARAERREQLLEAAMTIVRREGVDALTLGHLAERAGVSKPVVYDHFGTREGLLIALYRQMDERQVSALQTALDKLPRRLEDVADAVSAAYMKCATAAGPEWHAISAALRGNEEMEAVQQELVDACLALYKSAFKPFSKLSPGHLHLRCVGVLGAAETISREVTRGRITREAATTQLSALIADVVGGGRR